MLEGRIPPPPLSFVQKSSPVCTIPSKKYTPRCQRFEPSVVISVETARDLLWTRDLVQGESLIAGDWFGIAVWSDRDARRCPSVAGCFLLQGASKKLGKRWSPTREDFVIWDFMRFESKAMAEFVPSFIMSVWVWGGTPCWVVISWFLFVIQEPVTPLHTYSSKWCRLDPVQLLQQRQCLGKLCCITRVQAGEGVDWIGWKMELWVGTFFGTPN